jgi:hypothetical protein
MAVIAQQIGPGYSKVCQRPCFAFDDATHDPDGIAINADLACRLVGIGDQRGMKGGGPERGKCLFGPAGHQFQRIADTDRDDAVGGIHQGAMTPVEPHRAC